MADNIHTFNINIHEIVDKQAAESGLGKEAIDTIEGIKNRVPERVNITDPFKSKHIDSLLRDVSKISSELAKSLKSEFDAAIKEIGQDFATTLSEVSVSAVSRATKLPSATSMTSRQAAATSDVVFNVEKGFNKFKEKLFSSINTTLELELGNRFKVLGKNVEQAFSRIGNIERLSVVDVKALGNVLKEYGGSPEKYKDVDSMYRAVIDRIVNTVRPKGAPAAQLTKNEATAIYADIQRRGGYTGSVPGVKDISTKDQSTFVRELTSLITSERQVVKLLQETIHSTEVRTRLGSTVQNVDIPRYEVAAGGVPVVRTDTGSLRALQPRVKFRSGHMMAAEMIGMYGKKLEEFKEKLMSTEAQNIEELSRELWSKASSKKGQKLSGAIIDAAGKVLGGGYSDEALRVQAVKEGKDIVQLRRKTLAKIQKDMENMAKPYSELFHAMSSVEEVSVFDEMFTNLTRTGVGRTSPVLRFVQGLGTGSNRAASDFMRDVTRPIKSMEQYYPERPISSVQAQRSVGVETDFLTNRYFGRPQPAQEVQEIKAVNYLMSRAAPYTGQSFSTIGTSEGKAAHTGTTADENRLVLNMYRGDVSETVPFGAVRHEGRVIYPVSQARTFKYINKEGQVTADLPRVRSQFEAKAIHTGQYPKEGYGMNLVTKLVDSAGVFEDQFLVSSKVMKGFTTTVKSIIGDLETIKKLQATPGLTGEAAQKIIEASPEMAGVKLNTNADAIAVGKVERILSTSQSAEKAVAEIVNTVFSTFNTKLSTRFGSKGTVSFVAPEVLGTQTRSLSVGEMMTKLITARGGSEKALSYAKRFGAMPYLEGAAGSPQAEKTYKSAREAINKAIGVDLKKGPELAKQLASMIEKEFGKEALKVEVPVEAQISITGLTKRLNIGAEVGEMMAADIAGGTEAVIPKSGRQQVKILEQLNAMGAMLGYTPDKLKGGGAVNFLSPVTTSRGMEYAPVGTKFFLATGDKREQASWKEEDIYQGRRGTNLNPAGVAAYLTRYGVDTGMGESVMTRFFGKRENKEAALEYMKMRSIPEGTPQVSPETLAKIFPLEDASITVGTILDKSTGIHGKTMTVPEITADEITGLPIETGKTKQIYIPKKSVLETYTDKKLGKEMPTSITAAYDKLISSSTAYGTHKAGKTKEFEGIDYDFMRTNMRTVIGKRLAKVRETVDMLEKAAKMESEEMMAEAVERAEKDIAFLERLGVTGAQQVGEGKYQTYKPTGGILKDLYSSKQARSNVGYKGTMDYSLSVAPALESVLRGEKVDKEGISVARKALANIKDLFIRTNTREDARQIYEDAQELKKLSAKEITNLPIAPVTVEHITRGMTSPSANQPKYKRYWDEALRASYGEEWLANASEELIKSTKVEALRLMSEGRGEEVPAPLRKQIGVTAKNLTKGYSVSNFAGFINEVEDEVLKKAATTYGIDTSGKGFAVYKDVANLESAMGTIAKKPAEQLLGHKKGIEEMQTRVLPGVAGGTYNALIDKRKDFEESISLLYSAGAESAAKALEQVKKEHEKVIEAAKSRGDIVLREGEVGLSPKMMGLLRKTRDKSMRSEEAYVETTRFPITGEFSFQPAKAKLVNMQSQYMLGREAKAIALPSMAPGINYEQHKIAVTEAQKTISELRKQRASLGEGEAADRERAKLTAKINDTVKALTILEVKFRAAAQNLDFDGDTIFAHAATTKKANQEVKQAVDVLRTGVSGGNISPIAAMQLEVTKAGFPKKSRLSEVEDLYAKKRGTKSITDQVRIFGQTYNLEEIGSAPKLQYLQDLYKEQGKTFDPEAIVKLGGVKGKKSIDRAVEDLINKEFEFRLKEGSIQKHLTKPYLGQATESVNVMSRLAEGMYGVGNIASEYDKSPLMTGVKVGGKGQAGAYGLSRMHMMSAMMYKFINEGMATKHGGTPSYSKLHTALMSGTLMDELQKGGAFEGMGKLATAHTGAVRSNIEALSSKQFETEARRFLGKTFDVLKGKGASRKEITEQLVSKLSFEGMFNEMRSAVEHFVASGMKEYEENPEEALVKAKAKIAQEMEKKGDRFSLTGMLGKIYPSYSARSRGAAAKAGTQAGEDLLDAIFQGGDIAAMMARASVGESMLTKPIIPFKEYRGSVLGTKSVRAAAGAGGVGGGAGGAGGGAGGAGGTGGGAGGGGTGGGSGGGSGRRKKKRESWFDRVVDTEPDEPMGVDQYGPMYYNERGQRVFVKGINTRNPQPTGRPSGLKEALISKFGSEQVSEVTSLIGAYAKGGGAKEAMPKFAKVTESIGTGGFTKSIHAFANAVLASKAKEAGKSFSDYVKALETLEKEGVNASDKVIKDAEEARQFINQNIEAVKLASMSAPKSKKSLAPRALKSLKSQVALGGISAAAEPASSQDLEISDVQMASPKNKAEAKAIKKSIEEQEGNIFYEAQKRFPGKQDALAFLMDYAKSGPNTYLDKEELKKVFGKDAAKEVWDAVEYMRRNPKAGAEMSPVIKEAIDKAQQQGAPVPHGMVSSIWGRYYYNKALGYQERGNVAGAIDTIKTSLKKNTSPFKGQDADNLLKLAHARFGRTTVEDFIRGQNVGDELVTQALEYVLPKVLKGGVDRYDIAQKTEQILTSDKNLSQYGDRMAQTKFLLNTYRAFNFGSLTAGQEDALKQMQTFLTSNLRLQANKPQEAIDAIITGKETPLEHAAKMKLQQQFMREAMLEQATAGFETPPMAYTFTSKTKYGDLLRQRRQMRVEFDKEAQKYKVLDTAAPGYMSIEDLSKSMQAKIGRYEKGSRLRDLLSTVLGGEEDFYYTGEGGKQKRSVFGRVRDIYSMARTREGGKVDLMAAATDMSRLVEVLKEIKKEARGLDSEVASEITLFINELNKLVRGIHKSGTDLAKMKPAQAAPGVSYETPEMAAEIAKAQKRSLSGQLIAAAKAGQIKEGYSDILKTYAVDEEGRMLEQRSRVELRKSKAGGYYTRFSTIEKESMESLDKQALKRFQSEAKRGIMAGLIEGTKAPESMMSAIGAVVSSVRDVDLKTGRVRYKESGVSDVLRYASTLEERVRLGKDKKGNILSSEEIKTTKMVIAELNKLAKALSLTSDEVKKTKAMKEFTSEAEYNAIMGKGVLNKAKAQMEADIRAGRVRAGEERKITTTTLRDGEEIKRQYAIRAEKEALFGGGLKVTTKRITPEALQTGSRFGTALSRVAMWGGASGLTYGAIAQGREAVTTMVEVDKAMAELKKVMPAVTTNFDEMRDSAVRFAKDYGAEITQVLDTMRIFAQQGLAAPEVKEMARVSTLASNVTTMDPAKAAEALTSATRQFNIEGEKAIQILDAWNEVENNFAITSENLADAVKKTGMAAKIAGVDFDTLNGYVTAIGESTRQTGKEIGTSLKFIFSRLHTQKAPATLRSIAGVETTQGGNIRAGKDIIADLASTWDTLSESQKIAIAQAMGGIRQYNAVMVLMENYGRAMEAAAKSANSLGSAERENQIVMETTAKKYAQLKATIQEVYIKAGSAILPAVNTGLNIATGAVGGLSQIPGAGLGGMIGGAYLGATALGKWFDLSMFGLMSQDDKTGRYKRNLPSRRGIRELGAYVGRGTTAPLLSRQGLSERYTATRRLATAGRVVEGKGLQATAGMKMASALVTFGKFALIIAAIYAVLTLFEKGLKAATMSTEQFTSVLNEARDASTLANRFKTESQIASFKFEKANKLEEFYAGASKETITSRIAAGTYKSPMLLREQGYDKLRSIMTDVVMLTGEGVSNMDGFGKAVLSTNKSLDGTVASIKDMVSELAKARELAMINTQGFVMSQGMRGFTARGSSNKGFLGSIVSGLGTAALGIGNATGWNWLREMGLNTKTPFEKLLYARSNVMDVMSQAKGPIRMPNAELYTKDREAYNKQIEEYAKYREAMQEYKGASEAYTAGVMAKKREFFSVIPKTGVSTNVAGALMGNLGLQEMAGLEYGINKDRYRFLGEAVSPADQMAAYYMKLRGVNAGPSATMTLEKARMSGLNITGETFTGFRERAAQSIAAYNLARGGGPLNLPENALLSRQQLLFNQAQMYGKPGEQFRIGAGQVMYTPTEKGGMVEYMKVTKTKEGEKWQVVSQSLDEFTKSIQDSSGEVKGFTGSLEAAKVKYMEMSKLYTGVYGATAGMTMWPKEKGLELGPRYRFQMKNTDLIANAAYFKEGMGGTNYEGFNDFIKTQREAQERYRVILAEQKKATVSGKTLSYEDEKSLKELQKSLAIGTLALRSADALTDMAKAIDSLTLSAEKSKEVMKVTRQTSEYLGGPLAGMQRTPGEMRLLTGALGMAPQDYAYQLMRNRTGAAPFEELANLNIDRNVTIQKMKRAAQTTAEINYIQNVGSKRLVETGLVSKEDLANFQKLTSVTGNVGTAGMLTELQKQTGYLSEIAANTKYLGGVGISQLGETGSTMAFMRQGGTLEQTLQFARSELEKRVNSGENASKFIEDFYKEASSTYNVNRSDVIPQLQADAIGLGRTKAEELKGIDRSILTEDMRKRYDEVMNLAYTKKRVESGGYLYNKSRTVTESTLEKPAFTAAAREEQVKTAIEVANKARDILDSISKGQGVKRTSFGGAITEEKAAVNPLEALSEYQKNIMETLRKEYEQQTSSIQNLIRVMSMGKSTIDAFASAIDRAFKDIANLPSKLLNQTIQSQVNRNLIQARAGYTNLKGGMLNYQTPNLPIEQRNLSSQYSATELLYQTSPQFREQSTYYLQANETAMAERRKYETIVSARSQMEALMGAGGITEEQKNAYMQGIAVTGSADLGPLLGATNQVAENTGYMKKLLEDILKELGGTLPTGGGEQGQRVSMQQLEEIQLRRVKSSGAGAKALADILRDQVRPLENLKTSMLGGGLSQSGAFLQTMFSKAIGTYTPEEGKIIQEKRMADIINKNVIRPLAEFSDKIVNINKNLANMQRLTEVRADYRNIAGGPMKYQPLSANVDVRTSASQYSAHELLYNSNPAYRAQTLQYNLRMNEVNAARQKEEAVATLQSNFDFLQKQYGVAGAGRIAQGVLTTGSLESGALLGVMGGVEKNTATMVDLLRIIAGESKSGVGKQRGGGLGLDVGAEGGGLSLDALAEQARQQRQLAESMAMGPANALRRAQIEKQTRMDIAGGRFMGKEQYIREMAMAREAGTLTPEVAARNKALLMAGEADKQARRAFEYNKSKMLEEVGNKIGGMDSLINSIQSGLAGILTGRNTYRLDERFQRWSAANKSNPELVSDRTAQYNLAKSLYGQVMDYNMRGIDVGVSPGTMLNIARRASAGGDVMGALQRIAQELEKAKKQEEAKQRTLQAMEYADAMASVGNVPVVDAINAGNEELKKLTSILKPGTGLSQPNIPSAGQPITNQSVPATKQQLTPIAPAEPMSPKEKDDLRRRFDEYNKFKYGQLYINGKPYEEPSGGEGQLLINGKPYPELPKIKDVQTGVAKKTARFRNIEDITEPIDVDTSKPMYFSNINQTGTIEQVSQEEFTKRRSMLGGVAAPPVAEAELPLSLSDYIGSKIPKPPIGLGEYSFKPEQLGEEVKLPSLMDYISSKIPADFMPFEPSSSGGFFPTDTGVVSTMKPPKPLPKVTVPTESPDDVMSAMLAGDIPLDKKFAASVEALKAPVVDPVFMATIAASGGITAAGSGLMPSLTRTAMGAGTYTSNIMTADMLNTGALAGLEKLGIEPGDTTKQTMSLATGALAGGVVGLGKGLMGLAPNAVQGAFSGATNMFGLMSGNKAIYDLPDKLYTGDDKSKIGDVSSVITDTSDSIVDVKDTSDDLEDSLSDLIDKVDELSSKFSSLVESTTNVEESMDSLSVTAESAAEGLSSLDSAGLNASQLSDALADAVNKINTAADEFSPRAENTETSELDSRINDLTQLVSDLKEEVDYIRDNQDTQSLETLNNSISDLESKMEDLITTVSELGIEDADIKDSIDLINASMEVIKTDVSANYDLANTNAYDITDTGFRIDGLENTFKTTIEILQDSISQLVGQINGLQSQMAFTQLA